MTASYHYPTNDADHQLAVHLVDLIECRLNIGTAHQFHSISTISQRLAAHRGQKGLLVTKEKPTACDTYKWRRCE